jgi:hypothetical protein
VLQMHGGARELGGSLAGAASVPLPQPEHPLQRAVRDGQAAQLLTTRLHHRPDPAVGTEQDVGGDPGAHHLAVEEVKGGAVPGGQLGLRRSGLGITDDDLADAGEGEDRPFSVTVDVGDLRLDHREVEVQVCGLGGEHLAIAEDDEQTGHGHSLPARAVPRIPVCNGSVATVTVHPPPVHTDARIATREMQ